MDQLQTRLEALEHRTHTVERQLRWWRGLAGGLAVLGLLGWGLPLGLAREDAPDQEKGEKGLAHRVAALEKLLKHFSREGKEIFITGANLHIVNGLGRTSCTEDSGEPIPDCPNGLGNLIVGYNESRVPAPFCEDSPPGDPACTDIRTGSHNVVVGQGHNFSRFGGVVVGMRNAISGDFSAVSGGNDNTASGIFTSVSGGKRNTSSNEGASISGGVNNTASGDSAAVSGGVGNIASGQGSAVSGGEGNTANNNTSSVSAGLDNTASGEASSVSGGRFNTASGAWSAVSAGDGNLASGDASSVSGGGTRLFTAEGRNIASGTTSSVSGGRGNTASGEASSVSGGLNRTAEGEFDWVAGTLVEDE
jgi:hypothetical protein